MKLYALLFAVSLVAASSQQILGAVDTNIDETDGKTRDGDKVFSDLVNWITSGGAIISPAIHVVKYDGINDHRGIHATRDIAAGEVIISLPPKFILTPAVAQASEIGQVMAKSLGLEKEWDYSYISMFLCSERRRGKESEWAPYIASLPLDFSNMPYKYNDEERSHCRGTIFESNIENFDIQIQKQYSEICAIGICDGISLDDYIWGSTIVL